MDKREAASLVAILAAAFPQWPASRETVAVYVDLITDLDYDSTRLAIRELLTMEDRWPAIATVRRYSASHAGLLAPTPSEAWSEVRVCASQGGSHTRPSFTHLAITDTVASIGWWEITHSTNLETLRAQFLRLYADNQKRRDRDVLSPSDGIAIDAGATDRRRDDRTLAPPDAHST
jgi:hypothetical protein